MSAVADRVRNLVAQHLAVPVEKAADEALLVDDLGADSLDVIELELAVEEEFDIRFPATDDGVLQMAHTIGDVVAIVTKQLGKAR